MQQQITVPYYHQQIQKIIFTYNHHLHNLSQQDVFRQLQFLKNMDKQIVSMYELTVCKHIMLTRHGQSTVISEKQFGFNPNADLSQKAINSMKNTHKNTIGLLFFPDKQLNVLVSPMIRAKNTALLTLPFNHKMRIKICDFLSQNSLYPSGTGVISLQQAQQEQRNLSFWKYPLQKIVYKSSLLFFGSENRYNQIRNKSEQINKSLSLKAIEGGFQIFDNYNGKNVIPVENKQSQIFKQIISTAYINNDVWMFGHSGNFTHFCRSNLNEKERFDYCETRSVYLLKNKQNQNYLFVPAYKFKIDQDDGKISAKYQPDRFLLKKIQ